MNRYEAADRLASVIYNLGWGSLSYSEEGALQRDPELRSLVETMLQKYRRAGLLEVDTPRGPVSDPYEGNVLAAHGQWETYDAAREAQLWRRNAAFVLEIKEWPVAAFRSAVSAGAHQMILQQSLKGGQSEIIEQCLHLLRAHGCHEEAITAFEETLSRSPFGGDLPRQWG